MASSNIRLPNELMFLKNENFFDDIFFCCKKTNDLMIINSFDIVAKCIIYELEKVVYCVCEYENENEHDWFILLEIKFILKKNLNILLYFV